jgi:signal transduction histidine kinase
MVDTAGEIAAGDRSRRLDPSDPTTELGRMAAAFDTTIDALDRALTEAEEAEARSRRFLADAAHQLRTPLTGLRASAENLLADPDGPDRHRMAANVSREATRMARLVDRLLRIARIDRGEQPERRATDIVDLARTEVERQRPLAPHLDFVLDSVADVPVVRCEPEAVRDALANRLDNARRFARSRVEVGIDTTLGAVDLVVRDDGPGIAPERSEEIFHRFTTTSGGAGLGLPIARGIAEAHGGALALVGGAFVLTLPVAPLESDGRGVSRAR